MTEPLATAPALDVLTLPLRGSRLIEASAGTGKTWTIAALYLRLVLGHGPGRVLPQDEADADATPALAPRQVLVMTFTRAATRELSDRIRARLVEAAACFRGQAVPASGDTLLPALLAAYADGAAREQAAWRLAAAAEAMDEAAVFTIDAWCQRMLREHAFDSGAPFDDELQADESALRSEAAHDHWRQQVYALPDALLPTVLARWKTVQALQQDAAALAAALPGGVPPPAAASLAEVLADATGRRARALAALKAPWAARVDALLPVLQALWARRDKPLNGQRLGQAHTTRWLQALRDWAVDDAAEWPDVGKTAPDRLTPFNFAAALRPGVAVDTPPELAQIEALWPALRAALDDTDPVVAMRLHAAAGIEARVQQLKAQRGTLGFADLLQRLDEALDEARHGDAARRLRQRILAQYPVALIDEFQDTAPQQLRIFDRLYRIADNDPARALLLIGDPKQSIYAFRGADIHSYLRARRQTAGRHHALDTNHRSTQALVQALNALFGRAEARPGAGAFGFRDAASGDDPLPFIAVQARGRAEALVDGSGPVPALTLCAGTTLQPREAARTRYAALCAERIVALLNDPAAGFHGPGGTAAALRPADIAVLVRTGTEARAVRRALRQRGVASVYLSDRESVFASAEARELLRLLQAIAAPQDQRLVRAALAGTLLGLPLPELLALADDDAAFERAVALLRSLQQAWRSQGVLTALRQALQRLGLPARWLNGSGRAEDGERRLTNVLHLAELLQTASAALDGTQALLRWLATQIDDTLAGRGGGGGGDEPVLRLESDADLVQVVTVHKSKGLEYPLVFLPFAADFRETTRANTPVVLRRPPAGADGVTGAGAAAGVDASAGQLRLRPDAEDLAAEDRRRLQEDLRLLYVALTRARHALWVGAAALGDRSGRALWTRSALGRLVSGPDDADPARLHDDLAALAAQVPGLRLQTVDAGLTAVAGDGGVATGAPTLTRLRPRAALPPLPDAPPYAGRFDRDWTVSSYSALVRQAGDAAGLRPDGGPLAAAGASDAGVAAAGPRDAADAAPGDPTAAAAASPPPDDALPLRRNDEPAVDTGPVPGADRDDPAQPWHGFPRGARVGNFLHDQLEWLAGEGFALGTDPALTTTLRRRCERLGWGARAEAVDRWLRAVCSTPLPPLGVPLAALHSLRPEMEFWLPGDGLDTVRIDTLCRQHILPQQPRPALSARRLHGMLMGFADLVFEHAGRAWVLDHKSNHLGPGDAHYTPAALQAAVLAHRYDVQAALYLLALRRLLRSRTPAGRPPPQPAGALFLFLRGIQARSAGCLALAPPPALLDALDAMLVSPRSPGGVPVRSGEGA